VTGLVPLESSYAPLIDLMPDLDEATGWRPTLCTGWTVRDLVYHLLTDAQRALVALHTPATGPAEVDEVTYWQAWQPGTPVADSEQEQSLLGPVAERLPLFG
jgi:mycothiol maleylpyruvate isomerase-like protein